MGGCLLSNLESFVIITNAMIGESNDHDLQKLQSEGVIGMHRFCNATHERDCFVNRVKKSICRLYTVAYVA